MFDEQQKIICDIPVGSHMYGTSTERSDEDFLGVYLPSPKDFFGLTAPEKIISTGLKISIGRKNEAGDVDRSYLSFSRFCQLALDGQPAQLEMLFATGDYPHTKEWAQVLDNRRFFLSKLAILPFLGFARTQAHKAVMKGENLNLLRQLITDVGQKIKADIELQQRTKVS